ncbi:hypothetical protein [Antarcticimicrobium sp.]|uniref:hypothetical protein n=1 Tax=Antarcticimicrobium sp. TaxID=2824147 RepID=UPI0026231E39|nr:hypothetical protein [Antarcticimicrobium sp.]
MFHRGFLIGFLAADCMFLVIHAVFGLLTMRGVVEVWPDFFNVDRDWGGGEIFSYIKWALTIGAVVACFMKSRKPIFLGLGGLFLICLLDDSIGLHERGTLWLVDEFTIYRYFGAMQGVVGELIAWASLGIPAVACLGAGWWMSNSRDRRLILPGLMFFAGVVVSAVGMDVIHSSLPDRSLAAGLVGMLEEGGEMIFLSLLLAFVWGLLRRVDDLQEQAI